MFSKVSKNKVQGSSLLATLFVLSSVSVLIAITISRESTTQQTMSNEMSYVELDNMRDTIASRVIHQAKKYIWVSGGDLTTLLPSGADRFENWYADSYDKEELSLDDMGNAVSEIVQSVAYNVSVADNDDGDGDFNTDVDNRVFLRIEYNDGVSDRIIDMLISPGNPGTSTTAPAGMIASAGICYDKTKWNLNFLSLLSMPAGSSVAGDDVIAPGDDTCPSGGAPCIPTSPNDQWGAVTNSALGAYDTGSKSWSVGGTVYDVGHWGSGVGDAGIYTGLDNVAGDATPSIYAFDPNNPAAVFEEFCDTANRVKEVADDLLDQADPRMNYYSKGFFGTKKVYGDITFGTEADPEILYIKTGMFGQVEFRGKVSGYGYLIIDGNAEFKDDVEWNGMSYLNSFTLTNVAEFEKEANLYGGLINHNSLLVSMIGSTSLDWKFQDPSTIQYSSNSVDNVMAAMDDEYTTSTLAMPVLVESVQFIQ